MTARIDFEDRNLVDLIDGIAAEHHCTVPEILSMNKEQHVCAARRSLCVKLRAMGMSYPAVGRLVGRDHGTVIEMCTRKRWAASRHGRAAAE